MKRFKKTPITQEEFDTMKQMLDMKLNHAVIARLLNRSTAAITRIARVESWQAYVQAKKDYAQAANEKKLGKLSEPVQQSDSIELPQENNWSELTEINHSLQTIINRLETLIGIFSEED